VARYPVGCGAEEAEESGGGGGRGWEAHLFSPPLLLANAAAVALASTPRCVEARAAWLDFGGCAVEWERGKQGRIVHSASPIDQTRPGVGDVLHKLHSFRPAGPAKVSTIEVTNWESLELPIVKLIWVMAC
jgi:hypothetical protein